MTKDRDFAEITDLSKLRAIMAAQSVTRLYVKKLSPNDNSKNQVYLGGDFQSLNIIPNKGVEIDDTERGSVRDRFKAGISLSWVDATGAICIAPGAQLILYPKYPEVRMSGFLLGCRFAPSAMMTSRLEGRLMFLGIRDDGKIIGHVVSPDNPLAAELAQQKNLEVSGVFLKLPVDKVRVDTRGQLLAALREIHEAGWIDSVRLCPGGKLVPCLHSNCGGYTLESRLGITPNGISEPDYLGWEVKQHGVSDLAKPHSGSPITLFTPEPSAGFYKEKGVEAFIRKFGYADKVGRADRMNFGGIYRYGKPAASTGLTLTLKGYDAVKGKITDLEGGGIALVSGSSEEAAVWPFPQLMAHWNRKHSQAVYVPSLSRTEPSRQYRYGAKVELGTGTDFLKLLDAIAKGVVYYDPGIKLENASTDAAKTKRRSQFRIKEVDLQSLYSTYETASLVS